MIYCAQCGTELPDQAKFCRACGKALQQAPTLDAAFVAPSAAPAAAPSVVPSAAPAAAPSVASPPSRDTVADSSVELSSLSPALRSRRTIGVAVGLGSALMVAALAIPLFHKSNAPLPAAQKVAEEVAHKVVAGDPKATRLDLRAGDCGVKLGSNPITFGSTTIEAGTDADAKTLCRIAHESAERQASFIRKSLGDLCGTIQPQLRSTLGVDTFAQAAARMRETGADRSSATSQLYAMVTRCIDPTATVNAVVSTLRVSIYSVGRARVGGGGSCLAYLEETRTDAQGGSAGYDLHGTGRCKDADFTAADTFHPERNPTGRKVGDVMRTDFTYTGTLPQEWIYHGQTYAFVSAETAPGAPVAADAAMTNGPATDAPLAEDANAPATAASATGSPEASSTGGAEAPAASAPTLSADRLAALSTQELQALIEKGSADAFAEVGTRYMTGTGLPQDLARAVFWLQKAAERDVPRAQTNLGWLYVTGKGVEHNDQTAMGLFTKAAQQGYPNAEDSLGWMYEHGRGVPQDRAAAIGWYRKAAQQGFAKSQQNLARLGDG